MLGRAALRVERPQVGAVRLVGPRHGVARMPAGFGELLTGEVGGDGGEGERLDRATLGVGDVGQLGPGERRRRMPRHHACHGGTIAVGDLLAHLGVVGE